MPSVCLTHHPSTSAALLQRLQEAFAQRGFQRITAAETGQVDLTTVDVLVCLIGKDTFADPTVLQTIEHAHRLHKPMIPVFQESYQAIPTAEAPTPYVRTLLEQDGVQLFDERELNIPSALETLSRMIENQAPTTEQSTSLDARSTASLRLTIDNLAGQKLGQYEVRRLIGLGGMGAVYSAWQINLKRDVALKVLPPNLAQQQEFIERFSREAQTAAGLGHPNIVPIYDYGTLDGLSFVVMRLLAGGSLSERINHRLKQDGQLPSLNEVADVLKGLASALDYAHSRGVIHRDIKANNVMFDEQGTPFLVDFGIAKITNLTAGLTGTGVTMGTPSYMAPEQWRGESVTPATDQYALAVLTYHMLTGRLPFEATTPYALMHKHLSEEAPPPHTWRKDVPEAVHPVLSRALAKTPGLRYPSARDFATAFTDVIQNDPARDTRFFMTPLPGKADLIAPPLTPRPLTPTPKAPTPIAPLADHPTTPVPTATGAHTIVASALPSVSPPIASPSPRRIRRRRTQLIIGGAATAAILIAILAFGISRNRQAIQQATETANSFLVETSIALYATQTALSIPTETATPTVTPSATYTLTATNTLTPTPTSTTTQTATPTATRTPNPTMTPATPVAQALRSLTVRTGPGSEYPVAGRINRDDRLVIIGISEDGAWYQLLLPDGQRGWLAASASIETAGNLLAVPEVPAPTATGTSTPPPLAVGPPVTPDNLATRIPGTPTLAAQACPDGLPPRLSPGMQAIVSNDDPRPVNIRDGAGRSNRIVGTMEAEIRFAVLEGPVCADDLNWYRVRTAEETGWIAEGDDQYFVQPLLMLPTFTPTPLVTTTPGERVLTICQPLREDEFTNGRSTNAWFESANSSLSSYARIIDDYYELTINEPVEERAAAIWGSLRSYDLREGRVEAVIQSSHFEDAQVRTGLWLRYQDETNYLAFMIQGDGSFYIGRWDNNIYTPLVDWTESDAIHTGNDALNTLRVDIVRDEFSLYINGVLVGIAKDSTWQTGRIAFFGSSASENVPISFRMDYFRTCRL
jgi:serine/threonine protein kinase